MKSKALTDLSFSILELAGLAEGSTTLDTFHHALELAQLAERLGYKRFWLAEHHNTISVASSATAVLIGYIAGGTTSIRVGSGGIMLPNHAPLIVAEQFGTLATLYPGRIDLGLGRAPGTDQTTARAIRGENMNAVHNFPADIQSLQRFFSADNKFSKVRAFPGEGVDVPIYILGSSTDSARLAAAMGLPYAFAGHFAPALFSQAIDIYRHNFRPSAHLQAPYIMAGINVIAADTDEEAVWLASSMYQMFTGLVTGMLKKLQPPAKMDEIWNPYQEAAAKQMLDISFIGSPETLRKELMHFQAEHQVDELVAVSHIYDRKARLHSYEILAEVLKG